MQKQNSFPTPLILLFAAFQSAAAGLKELADALDAM